MATRIQLRRDTATQWAANNPTLSTGEAGFVSDTSRLKIGNGATAWNDLGYIQVHLGDDTVGNYIATIAGTADQISVSGSGSETSAVTLSLPQNIATTSSPTFAGATLDAITVGVTASNEIDTISGNLILDSAGGTVEIDDNLTISGNLTVNGTTTTVNSTTLTVDDKNIELGSTESPSDATADGGGITLKGTTDKTFNWSDTTDSWTSSEHIDLASGKVIKINGTQVLSATEYAGNAATVTNGVVTTGSYSDPTWLTISKSFVGLGNVENTAISTWAGSTNITTLGIVSSGTWEATDVGLSHGGTGASLTAVEGGVIYSTASAMAITSAGNAGQVLTSNGTSAPTWQDASGGGGFDAFLLSGM